MVRPHMIVIGGMVCVCLILGGVLLAQDSETLPLPTSIDCSPEGLDQLMQSLDETLPLDASSESGLEASAFYRRGLVYQYIALECGYAPTTEEISTSIDLTLNVADLAAILEAQSVGTDVEAALISIEDLSGDPSRGQQLYNGLELSLDGTKLTCFSCHNGQTAPEVEGTWTRIDEIRLQDPALENYSVEQYLVESIIHPNGYVVPGYIENLMPDYFGTRLDPQMLADLVAYLDSQDQLIETEEP